MNNEQQRELPCQINERTLNDLNKNPPICLYKKGYFSLIEDDGQISSMEAAERSLVVGQIYCINVLSPSSYILCLLLGNDSDVM